MCDPLTHTLELSPEIVCHIAHSGGLGPSRISIDVDVVLNKQGLITGVDKWTWFAGTINMLADMNFEARSDFVWCGTF